MQKKELNKKTILNKKIGKIDKIKKDCIYAR